MNPSLSKSPFLLMPGALASACVKFRLGSHNLPIELGRWQRKKRIDRLCPNCNVPGDEMHYLFDCPLINRDELVFDRNLESIWKNENTLTIMQQLIDAKYIEIN